MNTPIQHRVLPPRARYHWEVSDSTNTKLISQLFYDMMVSIKPVNALNGWRYSIKFLFITAAMLLLMFANPKPVLAGETVGNNLIDRWGPDNACGSIFMLTDDFTQKGRVTNWSFFADNANRSGNLITPLLIEEVAGEYFIRGIGTTRANMAAGVQSFSFGLVAGSDLVDTGFFIGWKDGSPTATGMPPTSPISCGRVIMDGSAGDDNNASVEFDFTQSGGGMLYFGPSHGDSHFSGGVTTLGKLTGTFQFNPPVLFNREYSFQAFSIKRIVIDIKPGSDPNCFNINDHGVIPVAILGNENFDVMDVDPESLLFNGLEVRIRGNKGPLCSFENSNMVCHFEDDEENWTGGTAEATVTGEKFDGTKFEGTDTICVVPRP